MMFSNNRGQKSPHLSNTASPLLSALQNPGEIFSRSIPFPSFPGSSPSSGAPNSLGSASGGVGLSGGPSPPPSAPASYSSPGGFSVPPRQTRGYPGFEEQYSAPNSSAGHFSPTKQRYPQNASPVAGHGQAKGGAHVQPGENNYACELTTIDELGIVGSNGRVAAGGTHGGGDNVVCLGWDGGVDVWRVNRASGEQFGRLEGLKGGVKSAKILPNPPVNDPFAAQRPLICLTIHSQIPRDAGNGDSDNQPAILLESDSPYSTSPPSRPHTSNGRLHDGESDWQTTVEVWSLATATRLATLFTSPPIQASEVGFGIQAPPPVWGGLRTQVSANRVVLGVGSSGELYVFGFDSNPGDDGAAEWKCLEKLWTSVQFLNGGISTEPGVGNFDPRTPFGGVPSTGTPVFDLCGRWLSYCPASAGSFSAGGEVGVPSVSPSVNAQTPPQQPAISAAVSLEDEAFFNKVAREVTQEVIRGAKWAADAGLKKFQSYWAGMGTQNGSPPTNVPTVMNGYTHANGSASNLHAGGHSQPSGLGQQILQMHQGGAPQQEYQQYYPQIAQEPRLVSIVDVQKLSFGGQRGNKPPMATFLPPAGVSYMSFAPGGLVLLTVSSKGDLLFVWDLLKLVHHPPQNAAGHQRNASVPPTMTEGKTGGPETLGRHVRQIARFTRMTVANVVDVDWASPRGEKIAVVTDRGTAHFYDLPYGALQWPPPARPPPSSTAVNSSQTTAAGAAVTTAVNLFNSSTQPLLTAARRHKSRSSSVGSPGAGAFPSPSNARRPAGSILGASPNDMPTGGNKIALPHALSGVAPGCIKFLTAKETGYVAVLGGSLLRIYELRPGGSGKKGSKTGGIASGKWWEYDLPLLPSAADPSVIETPDGTATCTWSARPSRAQNTDPGAEPGKTPIAWAEVETCSIFIPWHQERRVKMFLYTAKHIPPAPLPAAPPCKPLPTPDLHPELSQQTILAPSPITWNLDDSVPSSRAETPAPPPTKGKKKKKAQQQQARSPSPARPPPTPIDTPVSLPAASPPPPTPQAPKAPKVPKETWVFGAPIVAERIFLSDAGGRGDVAFVGAESGLEDAMRDGLGLRRAVVMTEEGFFEEEAEVLEL